MFKLKESIIISNLFIDGVLGFWGFGVLVIVDWLKVRSN